MAKARLQQERSRATRHAIVVAAETLWRDSAFDSVLVDDVCRQAGVAKGTFYFYFPRKEHLLVMLLFGRMFPKEQELTDLLASGRPTADVCAELLAIVARRTGKMDKTLVRRAIEESMRYYRDINRMDGGERSLRWYLDPILTRGVRRGEVDAGWDLPVVAMTIGWSTLQGILLWTTDALPDPDLETSLRRRAELIIAGSAQPRRTAPARRASAG
jgi:AcrR family transcriptional regulator